MEITRSMILCVCRSHWIVSTAFQVYRVIAITGTGDLKNTCLASRISKGGGNNWFESEGQLDFVLV